MIWRNILKRIALVLVLLFVSINLQLKADGTDFAFYPQFSYSDETGFMAGIISYFRFQFKDYPPEITRQNITANVVYSAKKQFAFRFMPSLYSRDGKYQLESKFDYDYWPTEFYGVGNKIFDKDPEEYTPQKINFDLRLRRNIKNKWHILALGEYFHSRLVKTEEGGDLEKKEILGSEDYQLVGLGTGLVYDSRSSTSYPTNGSLLDLSFKCYTKALGSDYNFLQFDLIGSKFFSLDSKQVLALTARTILTDRNAPFQKMPHLGMYMRAYNETRFIDQKLINLRAEYRLFPWSSKFFERIGFVLFFDTGQTVAQINDFRLNDMRCSYGAGLRFSVFLEDRFNLRLDFGFCKDDSNFEISGGESF